MTAPFNFNPEAVSAAIEVLDPDEYEVIVGEPKAFSREKAEGKGTSVGIRFPLSVAEGPSKGKKVFYTCYLTSDGAQAIAKQFLMAVHGFKRDAASEKEFNAAFRGADWGYDVTSGACGDAWNSAKGKRVRFAADVRTYEGAVQQEFKPGCFSPING